MNKMKNKNRLLQVHLAAHVLAILLYPLFKRKTSFIENRFEGYQAIEAIFPDPVLANQIATQLNKKVSTKILFEELLLIKALYIIPIGANDSLTIHDITGIGYLAKLQHLKLYNSTIKAIPDEFIYLKDLEEVDFTGGMLKEIPPYIFKFPSIEVIKFREQEITTISSDIKYALTLKTLDVSRNNIVKLPAEIGLLEELKHLYVQHNPLEELPNELVYLKELKTLDVSYTNVHDFPKYNETPEELKIVNVNHTNIKEVDDIIWVKSQYSLKLIGEQLDTTEQYERLEKKVLIDKKRKKTKKRKYLLSMTVATVVVVGSIIFGKKTKK